MSNVKITSDGTSQGTKVTVGGVEITDVTSISIEEIRAKSFVVAKIEVFEVELDIDADAPGGFMEVMVGGEVEMRKISHTDIILTSDGKEQGSINRPVLLPGEQAAYFVDGGRPVILRGLRV